MRSINQIVMDIRYLRKADADLLALHDRTVGPGAAVPNGSTGPLFSSDFSIVLDHLMAELGEAYMDQIEGGGK